MKTTGVRPLRSGKFEATWGSGGGRVSRTFASEADAVKWRGTMARDADARKPKTFGAIITEYLNSENVHVKPTTVDLLERLARDEKVNVPITAVDYDWADNFVSHQKKLLNAPSTIVAKVSVLAVVVDWHLRRTRSSAGNPLRNMNKGYANYKNNAVINVKRDRRLAPGEYERIVGAIEGSQINDSGIPFRCSDSTHLSMLFRLIVGTAMRLREAYSVRLKDINLSGAPFILLRKTKNGTGREVPLREDIRKQLCDYIADTGIENPDDPIFPFWSGIDSMKVLEGISNRLSKRFASVFKYAGVDDLTEHDLRHEGVCRWLELRATDGSWVFRSEEVRRITGHLTTSSFDRYASFRGNELAERMAKSIS